MIGNYKVTFGNALKKLLARNGGLAESDAFVVALELPALVMRSCFSPNLLVMDVGDKLVKYLCRGHERSCLVSAFERSNRMSVLIDLVNSADAKLSVHVSLRGPTKGGKQLYSLVVLYREDGEIHCALAEIVDHRS